MSSRSFTGYPFTGRRSTGYPFTGVQFGEVIDGLDILALFYKGSIPYYTSYTREGLAYTSAGTFAQDVPPYEIVDGEERFVTYEMTNMLKYNRDITQGFPVWDTSLTVIDATSFIATAQYQVIRQPVTTLDSESYTVSFFASVPIGCIALSNYSIQHIDSESGNNTSLPDLTTTPTQYSVTVLGKAGGGIVDFGIQDRNSSDWCQVNVTDWQVTNTDYLFPVTIPTTSAPVTVNKGTTSLLAEDDGAELARLPWVSPLGTKYGIKGALNGVDGNPATFSIPFTKYIPHGTTEDLPFVQHTTNDFVPLYREATTGLIKGTDGTNTCVSTAAATEGTTVSGWFSFNGPENEMWITLDGVKGSIATCLDALPDVGLRLYGLTAGTYQSIENLYVDNELPIQTGQGVWNTPLSAIKDNLLSDMWNTPLKEM